MTEELELNLGFGKENLAESRQEFNAPVLSDSHSDTPSFGGSSASSDSSEPESDDYDSDIVDDYERQLSDAQREWERSLEQLWQALTWVILPLAGKLVGRRIAGVIWRKVMNYTYS
ncbi:unnamed protein product [Kluyveromyces dobzhanskii CBS 2104]|uniref:WGS project CCBQ000000000 data, contig 00058 n=1 Tax=Kluyveromyces dobzhanskii CBS 2104 TaxID=1427455 RepID=A0A0A8LDH2_9SACH|nr:unnamed protein product [Kluyveromyces dobzhanskii CBS 2104]